MPPPLMSEDRDSARRGQLRPGGPRASTQLGAQTLKPAGAAVRFAELHAVILGRPPHQRFQMRALLAKKKPCPGSCAIQN
jgi:hypothetical protein